MYLYKKTYVQNWEHQKPAERHSITVKKGGKATNIKPERIAYIVESVGYWRKANQIHKWMVDNVQDGADDCKEYFVSEEKLKSLLDDVNEVLDASKLVKGKIKDGETREGGEWKPVMVDGEYIEDASVAQDLLPAGEGFFFGSTGYDEYYIEDLKDTKKILSKLLAELADKADYGSIYYTSSW